MSNFLATKFISSCFYIKNIVNFIKNIGSNWGINDAKKTNFSLTLTGRWLYSMWIIHSQLLWFTLVYNGLSLWTSM